MERGVHSRNTVNIWRRLNNILSKRTHLQRANCLYFLNPIIPGPKTRDDTDHSIYDRLFLYLIDTQRIYIPCLITNKHYKYSRAEMKPADFCVSNASGSHFHANFRSLQFRQHTHTD